MNYIRHLSAVFEKMDAQPGLTPYHISLYMALFRRWNQNFFNNPISVSRSEVMKCAKIGSVNTYLRSLRQLDQMGYIKYNPSRSRHRGSVIYMFIFDNTSEQDVRPYKNSYKTDTHTHAQKNENLNQENMKNNNWSGYGPDVPPAKEHVQIYFDEKGYPAVEGEKFYNYYQSNGWLVGGKSKMKDWKAAARNWILNLERFNNNAKRKKSGKKTGTPTNTNLGPNKDYSGPL